MVNVACFLEKDNISKRKHNNCSCGGMVIYDIIAYREMVLFVLNVYGIIRKIR